MDRLPDLRRSRESGTASALVACAIALSLVVCLLVVDLWQAVLGRARAQTAADAAALAAAGAIASGEGDPAGVAHVYARRNGAELETCACDPAAAEAVVTVRIDVPLGVVPGGPRSVRASARAVIEMPGWSGARGLQPWFAARVACLFGLVPGLSIVSGFRTRQQQAALYRDKPDLAAPPGMSLHELGLAVDLAFTDAAARRRAHALAGGCGLGFEVPGEPWHAAPIGWE